MMSPSLNMISKARVGMARMLMSVFIRSFDWTVAG